MRKLNSVNTFEDLRDVLQKPPSTFRTSNC
jgi:hypothetical protein